MTTANEFFQSQLFSLCCWRSGQWLVQGPCTEECHQWSLHRSPSLHLCGAHAMDSKHLSTLKTSTKKKEVWFSPRFKNPFLRDFFSKWPFWSSWNNAWPSATSKSKLWRYACTRWSMRSCVLSVTQQVPAISGMILMWMQKTTVAGIFARQDSFRPQWELHPHYHPLLRKYLRSTSVMVQPCKQHQAAMTMLRSFKSKTQDSRLYTHWTQLKTSYHIKLPSNFLTYLAFCSSRSCTISSASLLAASRVSRRNTAVIILITSVHRSLVGNPCNTQKFDLQPTQLGLTSWMTKNAKLLILFLNPDPIM